MITLADIQRARASISGVAARTSLIPLEHRGHTLYLKPENQQPVGAFKIRGAYNKIASLTDEERARGVAVLHHSRAERAWRRFVEALSTEN